MKVAHQKEIRIRRIVCCSSDFVRLQYKSLPYEKKFSLWYGKDDDDKWKASPVSPSFPHYVFVFMFLSIWSKMTPLENYANAAAPAKARAGNATFLIVFATSWVRLLWPA